MTGHIAGLPPELDRLVDGWLSLGAWPLADLAAAGVSLSEGCENKVDLGTDPASVASASAQLGAAGQLGLDLSAAAAQRDPRAVALAFLARRSVGAPGALSLSLTTDQGMEDVALLDLFPARTAAGDLVLGNLLTDPAHPTAFAAVGTPAATANAVTQHILSHGATPDNPIEFGSVIILTQRRATFGGEKNTFYDAHLRKSSNLFEVATQHGLRVSTVGRFTAPEFTAWLTTLISETVS